MNRADPASEEPNELVRLRARVAVLEQELEARDAFIIAAAHELRNPISPLMLHVQRLSGTARKAAAGSVPAPWLSDQMELVSKRLTRFLSALNRILDVSSIQRGSIHLVVEQVDLAEVTRDVVAGFERELEASGSSLTLELEDGNTAVGDWDRMRLEQIVSNLVSNAIRYGDSRPIQVTLRGPRRSDVAGEAATVELSVADRGVGIAEADQQRVFERFERAHTQYRSGFGVGLWMVRQLCEAMGGSVTLQSSAGEGSTFRVTLPTDFRSRDPARASTCDGSDDDR